MFLTMIFVVNAYYTKVTMLCVILILTSDRASLNHVSYFFISGQLLYTWCENNRN